MKEVADYEAVGKLKFKVVENVGRSVKSLVQRSNPTATAGCRSQACLTKRREDGGNCRWSNIQYEMHCKECPKENPTVYVGETSRNVYTRASDHFDTYRRRLKGGSRESNQRL